MTHTHSWAESRAGTLDQSRYRTEVDSVTEQEWSELGRHFEDASIYQTWAYGSIRWGEKNLSHIVLKDGDDPVAIAQLRIVRPKGIRAGVAYLRWGPLCHSRARGLDADVVRAMADALRKEYTDKRGLCLEIVPNAFEESRRAEVFQGAFEQYQRKSVVGTEKYRTFLLDLSPPLDDVRRALHRRWRGYLNAAERNELQVREGEDLERYDAFCRLYAQMWKRKRFRTGVRIEEFARIQERLPQFERMKIFLCEHKGSPVAALVCSAMGDTGIYLLGASIDADMRLKASYLLHWNVIKWLKNSGIRYYDLGGIDPIKNPGGFQFKRGLSGVDGSHISPLVACDNGLSMAFAKAGQVFSRGLRKYQQSLRRFQFSLPQS
jgi:lipid II:glycine glycyltransferase (peptidoglycan interpeptide bridge formation enzyme)